MNQYEIRIAKNQHEALHYKVILESDFVAIRKAQMLGDETHHVQVWRGMACLYDSKYESRLAS